MRIKGGKSMGWWQQIKQRFNSSSYVPHDLPIPTVAESQSKTNGYTQVTVPAKAAAIPPTLENADNSSRSSHFDLTNWVDEAYYEFERNGGFSELSGKGKPLPQVDTKGDPLQAILKNANYLPGWIELQHEIRDAIKKLHSSLEKGRTTSLNEEIEAINVKIIKYNRQVPHAYFQKTRLTSDNLAEQKDKWE